MDGALSFVYRTDGDTEFVGRHVGLLPCAARRFTGADEFCDVYSEKLITGNVLLDNIFIIDTESL